MAAGEATCVCSTGGHSARSSCPGRRWARRSCSTADPACPFS